MEFWYTLYTKPNAEYQVATSLQKRGIQAYLPEIEPPKTGQEQIKPFFPCYLFIEIDFERAAGHFRGAKLAHPTRTGAAELPRPSQPGAHPHQPPGESPIRGSNTASQASPPYPGPWPSHQKRLTPSFRKPALDKINRMQF